MPNWLLTRSPADRLLSLVPQALYKACLYAEAMDVVVKINTPELHGDIMKLQSAIKHGQGDVAAARTMIEECPPDDVDTIVNMVRIKIKPRVK